MGYLSASFCSGLLCALDLRIKRKCGHFQSGFEAFVDDCLARLNIVVSNQLPAGWMWLRMDSMRFVITDSECNSEISTTIL